jgi:hypothetical protein
LRGRVRHLAIYQAYLAMGSFSENCAALTLAALCLATPAKAGTFDVKTPEITQGQTTFT